MPIHVTRSLMIDELPEDCIDDCSAPGQANETVEFWRKELEFTVDADNARTYLRSAGTWSEEELAGFEDDELASVILWLACCNFHEFKTWQERNPGADPCDADWGSGIFSLEG